MAAQSYAKVTILGDSVSLERAAARAQGSLGRLQKGSAKASRNITRAFGAIGVGLSFTALERSLKKVTTAAIEDNKSIARLNQTLEKTTGVTGKVADELDGAIGRLSRMAGVADDEIRPAMATFLRYTGKVGKSLHLTRIAMDIAASTGKPLATVTKALAKAYDGNAGALQRLGVKISDTKHPIRELMNEFDGAAKTVAATDPYQRMSVIFDELSETIGKKFVPYVQNMAEWFDKNYDKISRFIDDVLGAPVWGQLANIGKTLHDNVLIPIGEWFASKKTQDAFKAINTKLESFFGHIQNIVDSKFVAWLGSIVGETVIKGLQLLLGLLDGIADAIDRITNSNFEFGNADKNFSAAINPFQSYNQMRGIATPLGDIAGNMSVVNQITINSGADAGQIIKLIKKYSGTNGYKNWPGATY